MNEIYEFRVREKHAGRLFRQDEGIRLSIGKPGSKLAGFSKDLAVRKVQVSPDDPRFTQIGVLNALLKEQQDWFFAGWEVNRRYTSDELRKAEVLLLHNLWTFEPAGEECGTRYEETSACPLCKSGAAQITPLYLDWKRILRGKDIARTIAGEIIVSRRMVEIFKRQSITGADFRPVRERPASSAESKDWFQLDVKTWEAQVAPLTKTGINPFDQDMAGEYRCPCGDLIGLARFSELFITRSSYTISDVVATSQFVGARRGLLRPERLFLVSPKFRRVIEDEKLRGCKFEIVHLV